MEKWITQMKQISSLITTKPKDHSLPSSMGLSELGLGTKLDGNQIKKAQAYLTKRTNPDQTQTDLLTSIQSLTESNIEMRPKLGSLGSVAKCVIHCKDVDNLKEHAKNETLHMPFEKKIEVFVPRVESDSRLKNIEDTQEKMYNLLLKNNK